MNPRLTIGGLLHHLRPRSGDDRAPSAPASRSSSSMPILSVAIVVSFRVVGCLLQRREDDAVAVRCLGHLPCYTKGRGMTPPEGPRLADVWHLPLSQTRD